MSFLWLLFLFCFCIYLECIVIGEGIVKFENCFKLRIVEVNVFMLEEKRYRGYMLKVFRYWKEILLRGNRLIIFLISLNCKYWWEVIRG